MNLEPVVLEGRWVRLEPLAREHLPDLERVGLDPELWRWGLTPVRNADDLRRYVEDAQAERERGVSLPFAIVERSGGRAIGSTRYGSLALEHRRVEIGWTWLARAWQRTAVNTEAKLLRSRTAILRIGAREEGTLRAHMVTSEGRVRDSVYYAIVADEWPGVRARLEKRLAVVRRPRTQ